ncbi:uncharacterized protein UMAG_06155 [Mycosarcoma maydis]|uniref:UNC-45/Cro1/She4 central domain-containing protein n=1 Tax=Mycosarcoma maydis TaxID=5270 RepID=A0A0D1DML4_MYCMD|nr:uncharacterized protein UMAG_06155 [Ustilago maydis 521]KIS65774.1 hypothetical protein UMAG_06155 [Ustilago maydis 521]|eukprot:XP_011392534.1 hypothetical protein UMAG_06155 [Ustilago maydis 521]
MQEELVDSIRSFSISDDPLSTATAQTFVDAFAPLSHVQGGRLSQPLTYNDHASALVNLKQARSTALLTLASRSSSTNVRVPFKSSKPDTTRANNIDENIAQLLTPVIRSRLADTTPHSLLSALNFFSALFSVLANEAHDILIADGILNLVLEAPEACNALTQRRKGNQNQTAHSIWALSDETLVSLAVAELFSAAANSNATRKYLAGQQAVLDWLDIASVSHGTTSSSEKQRSSDAVAIVAGLADIKVYRATDSEAVHGLSQVASAQPTSQQDHVRQIQEARLQRRRKDEALYRTVHDELLANVSQPCQSPSQAPCVEISHTEIRRTVELSCLEVLAYLTVQPTFKERITVDRQLLQVLCTSFDLIPPNASERSQTLGIDSQRFDGALQLGLATILSNITAYPPILTAEERQVRRLRKFADAQGEKQGGSQPQEQDELETTASVEQRCTAVFEARGVETLCAIAVTGPHPSSGKAAADATANNSGWQFNPSKSVRRACGSALLALLTKQDRIMRGKAVQQGALKAALALSAPVLHTLQASRSKSEGLFARSSEESTAVEITSDDLAPLQALAKLLISLNPSLLFPSTDGLVSVASLICSLLLCQAASRLQKFESLLALTNLASLSADVCMRIATFSLEPTGGKTGETQDGSKLFSTTSVLAQACEQLLLEDHTMVRRAWIELLVNLLQVEPVLTYFVATERRSAASLAQEIADEPQDRLSLRLRVLLGLSEADDWAYKRRSKASKMSGSSQASSDSDEGEASLATRMASLALLATVSESGTTIEALMTIDRLFSVLLSNIVLDRSEDVERNNWEQADLWPTVADPNRNGADMEAEMQLNGINLSLRASCVLLNVLQYLSEPQGKILKGRGGFEQAQMQTLLQQSLGHHLKQLRTSSMPAHVQEARRGLLQVMAECLRLVKDM